MLLLSLFCFIVTLLCSIKGSFTIIIIRLAPAAVHKHQESMNVTVGYWYCCTDIILVYIM